MINYGTSMSLKTAGKGVVSLSVTELGLSFAVSNFLQGFINSQFILAERYRETYRRRLFKLLT